MAFKFVAFFALIAAASAAPQHQYYEQAVNSYQPAVVKQIVQPIVKKIVEHEEPANYDFEYAVHDDHTGDIKEHHESAKNGAVSGYYTLIDADGYRRIVHYTADHEHGFNAEVRREPVEGHKVVKTVQPVVTKVVQPAIAVQKLIVPAPAPAPVVPQYYEHAAAPAQQYYEHASAPQYYAPAPVKVAVAQPTYTKVVAQPAHSHSYEDNHGFSSHVSFKGPSSQYSY